MSLLERLLASKHFITLIPMITIIRSNFYSNKSAIKGSKFVDSNHGLPRLPRVFKLWERLVRVYIVYVIIRYTCSKFLTNQLANYLDIQDRTELNCYLISGRFIYHDYIEVEMSFLLAIMHVSWRLYQNYNNRLHNSFSMFTFLLFDEQLLTQFYAHYHSHHSSQYDLAHYSAYKRQKMHQSIKSPAKFLDPKFDSIRQIVCYPVQTTSDTQIGYKIRPNRRMKMRNLLRDCNRKTITFMFCLFLAFSPFLGPFLAYVGLDHQRYLRRYPKCDDLISGHLVLVWAADAAENAIIWVDTGVALFTGWANIYLLNYDIQLYWRELNSRLNLITYEAQNYYQLYGHLASRQLDESVYHLQVELYDFFKRTSEANQVISQFTTYVNIVWITFFIFLGHYSLEYYELSGRLNLTFMFIILMCTNMTCITVGSFILFKAHRNSLQLHATIRRLIGYYQGKHKRLFLQILDYRLLKYRGIYTIFGNTPYAKAFYLTIFSWSISGFVILETLVRR